MPGVNEVILVDSAKAVKNPSTGTRDEPISLLDDDVEVDGCDDNANANDDETISLEKRKISQNRENASKKAKIQLVEIEAEQSNISKHDGCMLTPRHPIKIFATDRDKTIRRRLRRSLTNPSTKANDANMTAAANANNYHHHWSTFHCWTFREMLGFDRFSGLRQQQQPPKSNSLVQNTVGIDWIFIATYIIDVDFLLNELPELVDVPIVVIVYQYKDESPSGREQRWVQIAASRGHSLIFLVRDPRAPAGTETNPHHGSSSAAATTMDYGCHHTKMTLIQYSSGRLRVHIHTSNLGREDVHEKCQGAFLQDFLPKTEEQLCDFATSAFEESLVTYLESYNFVTPLVWKTPHHPKNDTTKNAEGDYVETVTETMVSHLQTYDFSNAVGVLIPSIPGYHKNIRIRKRDKAMTNESSSSHDDDAKLYGYLKVQQAIRDHCCKIDNNKDNPNLNKNHNHRSGGSSIVCQFSSMGSLSKPYLNKLADAWNADAATIGASTTTPMKMKKKAKLAAEGLLPPLSLLTIVWPTVEEIVTSVEGRYGGASVPGRTKNLTKDFLRPLLHKWRSRRSNSNGDEDDAHEDDYLQLDKGRHVPHIKSYYQICNDNNDDDDEDEDDHGVDNIDRSGNTNNMRWFVLSSHNLSKAAWGEIQNRMDPHRGGGYRTEVLAIQHWELGVFVSPSTLGVDAMGPLSKTNPSVHNRKRKASTSEGSKSHRHEQHSRAVIPLPYKFRPDKYQDSDQPWVVE
jgi:tyrosyl-DNA phosphodiesterase-1